MSKHLKFILRGHSKTTFHRHRGEFEVAEGISAALFNSILEYYTTGVLRCPPDVTVQEVREACDYFLIPFNAATIKAQVFSPFHLITYLLVSTFLITELERIAP